MKSHPCGLISRIKASFSAKEFTQKQGIDYNEVYAPTTRYNSVAVAANNNYQKMQFDAVLYGALDEDIFIEPPVGADCPPNLLVAGIENFMLFYMLSVFVRVIQTNALKVLLSLHVANRLLFAKICLKLKQSSNINLKLQ